MTSPHSSVGGGMSVLLDLATRCEEAMGPDIDLDLAISEATKAWKTAPTWRQFRPTASLDAAMTLVPEGHTWQLSVGNAAIAYVTNVTGEALQPPLDYHSHVPHPQPALALCAAALRARAA